MGRDDYDYGMEEHEYEQALEAHQEHLADIQKGAAQEVRDEFVQAIHDNTLQDLYALTLEMASVDPTLDALELTQELYKFNNRLD